MLSLFTLSLASLPCDLSLIAQFVSSPDWSTYEVLSMDGAKKGIRFVDDFLNNQVSAQQPKKYPLTAIIPAVQKLVIDAQYDEDQLTILSNIGSQTGRRLSMGYFLTPLVVNQVMVSGANQTDQVRALLKMVNYSLAVDKARLADPKKAFVLGVRKQGSDFIFVCTPEQQGKTASELLTQAAHGPLSMLVSEADVTYLSQVQKNSILDVSKTITAIKNYENSVDKNEILIEKSALALLHYGLYKLID